jgi:SAM-dependent methyltransferase
MIELVTGQAYVDAISASESDRACRAAFLELARSLAPPRGDLLDFGCGPGLDARVYAELGLRVCAFDIDAGMCASFRTHCAREMAKGQVQLIEARYDDFLALNMGPVPRLDLVTANFAPLNLAPDPAPLFAAFDKLLKPTGVVLASVLNPFYAGDLRHAWWWAGLPALLARGRYSVVGAQAPITRWLPRCLARTAAPQFQLEAIHVPPRRDAASPRRVRMARPIDWPAMSAARFLFLQWRRRTASA